MSPNKSKKKERRPKESISKSIKAKKMAKKRDKDKINQNPKRFGQKKATRNPYPKR
jgi:hypothetical protein